MDSTTAKAFLLGGFGGTLPTISKLASTFVTTPGTPFPELGLYIGIALWALIGGAVALTNATYDRRQAIYAGIAAPAIIASLVAGGAQQATSTATVSLLSISAMAQDAEGKPLQAEGGAILFSPKVTGGLPRSASIPITAEVKDATGSVKTIDIGTIRNLSAPSSFTLPVGAQQVFVSGKPVDLTNTTNGLTSVNVNVVTSPSSGGDFLWALGLPRHFKIQDITVTPKSAPGLDLQPGAKGVEPPPKP